MVPTWLERGVIPFLLLAYPVTFLLYRGGRFCGPLCFEPTLSGSFALFGVLLVVLLVGSGVAAIVRDRTPQRDERWLAPPPRHATVVLLSLFGAFVVFLTLDALSVYESIWKPIVLPASLLVFPPVWLFYAASFPLALLFSAVGFETGTLVTLAFRSVVLAIGFPLSTALHVFLLSKLTDWPVSGGDPVSTVD